MVPAKNIKIYKDTDKDIPLYISDASGAIDLTSDNVYFTVSETISGTPDITKDTAGVGGITIDSDQVGNKGKCIIRIDRADTTDLDSGKYYYRVFHDNGTDYKAVVMGFFWITEVAPSHVDLIRKQLDDAGELRVMTVQDEMIYPASLNTVYVSRPRIQSVIGVWIFTDDGHTGTNYYTGGGFDASTGKIWLGTPLVSTAAFVRVSYTWESGIDYETIQWHLDSSKTWVVEYTGVAFTYGNASNNTEKTAENCAIAAAILGAILTINGANVAQLGYNFRLHEFEVQTKLWGEGMIAEALFGVYIKRIDWYLYTLGKAGEVLLVNQPDATKKYNIETLIEFSTGAEGDENV